MQTSPRVVALASLLLVLAACGSGTTDTTVAATNPPPTTGAPTPTQAPATAAEGEMRQVQVAQASITVDGDPSDWAEIPGLDLTLDPIQKEADDVAPVDAKIQVAQDAENVYVLFSVNDDFNWDAADAHKSSAAAILWAIDSGSGPHMGANDEDAEVSAGKVDIWHWELECGAGEQAGGAVSDAGDGDLGNDAACNFDDEWATDAETREDDNGAGAENSLLGVWTHSATGQDADGTWYFEMSRPLQTGDENDAQFTAGQTALMAVAYWDPDFGPDGWDDDTHVQSSTQGWIAVNF